MNDMLKERQLEKAALRPPKKPAWRKLYDNLRKQRIMGLAVLACLLGTLYWSVVASDRYVSEAHVIIQHTDLSTTPTVSFSSILGDVNAGTRVEQLLLRDYLLSVDMLKKLDAKLNLRAHYSDSSHDLLSRMWFSDAKLERFYNYYLTRVSVEFDDYAGVVIIKAQAYDAKTALAIASMMVEEGERYMNAIANKIAQGQVTFLEKQVEQLNERAVEARRKMLEFQNTHNLVSPQGTAENFANIIGRLESQLTDLQARRAAMLGYLMPKSPNIVDLDQQIGALERQIAHEKARLTATTGNGANGTLNAAVEQYQRLQLNAEFTQDVYKTALATLEKGRIEATRMLRQVSILQSPGLPQYPLEPRRIYNIVVFILAALVIAGILQLLVAIVRDHKD